MPDIVVEPVETKPQQTEFLELPWSMYAGDPHWVRPDKGLQAELCGFQGQHPFHAENQSQAFIAARNGEPCGRILAVENRSTLELYDDSRGYFGFFESTDDQAVANALFDATLDWLRQRGLDRVRGPVNPSLNYEAGLLVDGFDRPPLFTMTYNLPYYGHLFDEYGFRKAQNMYAYWGDLDMLSKIPKKYYFVIEQVIKRLKIKRRHFDPGNMIEDLKTSIDLFNQAVIGKWGYMPITPEERDRMAEVTAPLVVPEGTGLAYIDDRPVGSVFCLLDYNQLIRECPEGENPFAEPRLSQAKQTIRQMRLLSALVLPEYQRWGLGPALINFVGQPLMEYGIERAEFSWVFENNLLSYKSLERGGARRYKTYRLFDYGPE